MLKSLPATQLIQLRLDAQTQLPNMPRLRLLRMTQNSTDVAGTAVKYIIDPGNSTHLATWTECQTFVSTPAESEGLSRRIDALLHSGGHNNKDHST